MGRMQHCSILHFLMLKCNGCMQLKMTFILVGRCKDKQISHFSWLDFQRWHMWESKTVCENIIVPKKEKKSTDKIIEKERKDNAHTFSSSKKFVSADIIMAAFFQHMISMLMKFWWPKFRKRVKGCFCFEKRRKNIKKSFSFFPQANSHWHFCSNSWQVFFGICDR